MANTVNAPDPTASNWPRLYALLNADAKSWWYHADLTKQGQHKKARQLELRSLRERVRTLKEWKLNNTTIHWSEASGQYYTDNINTYDAQGHVSGSHSLSFGGYRHGNALAVAAYYMGLTIIGANLASAPHMVMIEKAS